MDTFFEDILRKVKKKSLIIRIITLLISLFVLSLVYNLFLLLPQDALRILLFLSSTL